MKNRVSETIKKYNMLTEGERVLVGFSGGADSTALLMVLKELQYDVFAVHVNHCLRGDESDGDEKFCEEFCKRNHITLFIEKVDVITYCNNNKTGTEEGARVLRYEALQKHAQGAKIATAHNLNDCLETTLINLSRGTALKGLCGVPPVRDNIIRPLIETTRAEIEKYLEEKGQPFVTDSTNLSDDYTRNRIRHNVIPQLEKINGGLYNSFRRTRDNLISEENYLDKVSRNLLKSAECEGGYSCEKLVCQDDVIVKRCIANLLKDNKLNCSYDMVEDILRIVKSGGKINISDNVYAVSVAGIISIRKIKNDNKDFEKEINKSQSFNINDKNVKILISGSENVNKQLNVHNLLANANIDYDKIQGKVVLRNRRPGDRIKFCGRDFTTSVKKLFNRDIPNEKRDDIVFLADDEGVIFIEGYGISSRVATCDSTKKVLSVEICKGE